MAYFGFSLFKWLCISLKDDPLGAKSKCWKVREKGITDRMLKTTASAEREIMTASCPNLWSNKKTFVKEVITGMQNSLKATMKGESTSSTDRFQAPSHCWTKMADSVVVKGEPGGNCLSSTLPGGHYAPLDWQRLSGISGKGLFQPYMETEPGAYWLQSLCCITELHPHSSYFLKGPPAIVPAGQNNRSSCSLSIILHLSSPPLIPESRCQSGEDQWFLNFWALGRLFRITISPGLTGSDVMATNVMPEPAAIVAIATQWFLEDPSSMSLSPTVMSHEAFQCICQKCPTTQYFLTFMWWRHCSWLKPKDMWLWMFPAHFVQSFSYLTWLSMIFQSQLPTNIPKHPALLTLSRDVPHR